MSHVESVVIVGAPRSGTNMLRDVLASLPGFETWPCDEINHIWKHGNRWVMHDELSPTLARPEVNGYLERQFAKLRSQSGAQVVIEKTCATSLRAGFAATALPAARFVFIRRHGMDAAASTAKRWNAPFELAYTARKARYVPPADVPFYAWGYLRDRISKARTSERERDVTSWWGPRPHDFLALQQQFGLPDLAAIQWQRCVTASADQLNQWAAGRFIEVAYEDFVTTPADELNRILEFLGHADSYRPEAVGKVRASSVGKAAQTLDAAARQRLTEALGPTLRRFGYA